jgi:hypothetical protein
MQERRHKKKQKLPLSPSWLCWEKRIRVANLDTLEISICILPTSEEEMKGREERRGEGKTAIGHIEDECEEHLPNNLPCAEEEEPLEDKLFCPHGSDSPCQFIQ